MDDAIQPFASRPMVLLSNREPYEHVRTPDGVTVRFPPGGVVSALDPVLRRVGGTCVAWGSGSADRDATGPDGRLAVPPDDPAYTLRRVWLDDDDVEGFYLGFSNGALWPICHMFLQHLEVRRAHWQSYQKVNSCFADAVLEEVASYGAVRPAVWIHDYHFALVPALLRERAPELFLHHFWHIPFPAPDVFDLMPRRVHADLLRGLLGNDLLEFQTPASVRNFLDAVERAFPDVRVDRDRLVVEHDGGRTHVGAFPISIDVASYERAAASPASSELCGTLRARYARAGRQLGLSVDRVDYTKGIRRRLRALNQLWADEPAQRERFTMVFITSASRSELQAYADLDREVLRDVAEINERYGTAEWQPIVLERDGIEPETLPAYYRAADLCLVSSVQDGMNLVAKEFIASQIEERGVLVLSRFTGAAEEIDGAVLINPFFVDAFADGIAEALFMPDAERRARMRGMRERLRGATIHDWVDSILTRAAELDAQRPRHATP